MLLLRTLFTLLKSCVYPKRYNNTRFTKATKQIDSEALQITV
jgi:hypothetical protein